MNSKSGTLLNGTQIRGQTVVLTEPENELILGKCPQPLRIVWHPVVLSASFTKREVESGAWERLRDQLEQLDIKYTGVYDQLTTHVVSKKRNTARTLQALVNGKHIVTEGFVNAIVEAATVSDDAEEGTPSALESTFDEAWPNATDYLPPRGDEPTQRPATDYAPEERRQEVFAGYSFVFYNQKQHENLAPVIQWGKGKAFLKEVVEGVTEVDDFVRYVKGIAGEKGAGPLEDGSDGKKVVVVRYAPGKGDDVEWWTNFYVSFARHLDHRPPDQKEFLEAILACDASLLRRHLEEDTQPSSTANLTQKAQPASEDRMQIDDQPDQEKEATPPRRRARAGARSRFKGFDFSDSDDDKDEPMTDVPSAAAPAAATTRATQVRDEVPASQDSQSLFVSQRQEPVDYDDFSEQESRTATNNTRSTRSQQPSRKRALSPLPEHEVSEFLDAIAPTAAAAKRRRIEAGQPAIPEPSPEPEEQEPPAAGEDADNKDKVLDSPKGGGKGGKKGKKGKKGGGDGDDILELARKKREEAEALAAAERQAQLDSAEAEGEIDYAAIRRLHIIEEFDVRLPDRDNHDANEDDPDARRTRAREQDIADGRWDPRWNGRKNFKKFRKVRPGDTSASVDIEQPRRPAITLEEVAPKDKGIGDDYWLEDTGRDSRRNTQTQTQTQRQSQAQAQTASAGGTSQQPSSGTSRSRAAGASLPTRRSLMATLDSSDEEAQDDDEAPPPPYSETAAPEPSRSRAAKAAERATTSTARRATQQQSGEISSGSAAGTSGAGSKHGTPAGGEQPPPAKRARRGFMVKDSEEEDSDDDELKFKFGRRRR
ncbi:hypothetical protein B0T20DRAFT_423906 [Sordaria brevicollis]|uniref:Nibrin second BRCT domain-containing protein n=1 Tax=Sordaria brevicollis TaxID=83679 RepID=A0AAE0U5B9_SORBR|nr:hypothetical protein B0T20DRAFT_423906 [Sordaria brevicollis]